MDDKRHTVDCRWLLSLYAIVPLFGAIVIVDLIWLESNLLDNVLPSEPEHWPFWTVVAGTPHIIASALTMADREYLGHYRRVLFKPLLLFVVLATAGYLGPQPLSLNLLFVILAFYTIYHVLAQQLGLTLMMMGVPPSKLFLSWKWTAIFAAFAIYMIVYGQTRVGSLNLGPITLYELLAFVAAGLVAVMIVLALYLSQKSRYRIGTLYLWGNVALLVSVFLINEIGYTVFVIVMPQIIHDLTAYSVYITHDRNRNKGKPRNILYNLTRTFRLPAYLLLPLASLSIAYALTSNQNHTLIGITLVSISLLHYYFEGFIWRGNSPHKQHLGFRR